MQPRTATDHLGKTYPTIRDMCRAWNITEGQFDSRRSHGWTIKECLTIPRGARRNQGEITDHLGNKYPSYQAMCDAYHISDSTYQERIKRGLSQKDALTMTKAEALNKHVHDHLGQEFPSKAAMCDHWGISRQIYFGRIGMGWSLKDALETPIVEISANSKQVTDHEGNVFDSISDLCTYWKVGRTTYNQRIKAGWSMKDALTKHQQSRPVVKSEWTDHLGQKFESLNEMCRHWGVSRATFSSRIHKTGWSIERALTTKEAVINATIVKSSLINFF